MTTNTKYCVDCKWVEDSTASVLGCTNPKIKPLSASGEVDLTTGKSTKTVYQWCNIARTEHYACGPEGKLWEAKNTPLQEGVLLNG